MSTFFVSTPSLASSTIAPKPKASGLIRPLTGIRGLAAFAVMLTHVYGQTGLNQTGFTLGPLQPLANYGWMGVDLFFILSGFVMAMVHQKDFAVLTWASCVRYWQLRVARVYPLHAVLLGLFGLYVLVRAGLHLPLRDGSTLGHFVASLLLIQIWTPVQSAFNPPSWSVAAEALAYLWFPVTGHLTGGIRTLKGALLSLVMFVVGFKWMLMAWPLDQLLPAVYTNTHGVHEALRIAQQFGIGCLLFNVYKQPGLLSSGWCDGLGVTALVALYALMAWALPTDAMLAAMACLVLALAKPGPLLNGLLGNKVAVYLGEVSYAMYLCHTFLIMIVTGLLPKLPHTPVVLWGVVAFYTLATLGFAHVLYTYVETPARKWLRQCWAKPALS
jgi:peptidoglycan/LPS O-acetylase OafA/YrhL